MNGSSVCLKEPLSNHVSFIINSCLLMTQPTPPHVHKATCSDYYHAIISSLFGCSADVLPFYNAYFGEHSSPGTNLTYLYCYGNESRLIDCRHTTTTSCSASNVAGVRCQGKTVAGIKWCSVISYKFHMYIYIYIYC